MTWQVELDLSACFPAFSYAPGDAVGMRCPNREAAVAVVLARCVRARVRSEGFVSVDSALSHRSAHRHITTNNFNHRLGMAEGTAAAAEQRQKRIAVVGGTALGGLLDQGASVEEAVRCVCACLLWLIRYG